MLVVQPPFDKNNSAYPSSRRLNRRRLLQLAVAAAVVGPVAYLGLTRSSGRSVVRYSRPMMGTIVNLTVCGPSEQECQAAIDACLTRMDQLSAMMSTYNPDSPISRLNRDGILTAAPPELIEVFTLSRRISELTGGAFDPTVLPLVKLFREVKRTGELPSEEIIKDALRLVDYRNIVIEAPNTVRYAKPGIQATLDGIAKGYIVDQGVEMIRRQNIADAYVEAGGDLMTIGRRQDGKPWRIGIRNPRSDDLQKMDAIDLSNRAIATSGDYMQYFTGDKKNHHIINPHTGFSPLRTASSSILAPTVAEADALATATMVLGPEESVALIESLPECEGYFIDKDLKKYQTKGFFS